MPEHQSAAVIFKEYVAKSTHIPPMMNYTAGERADNVSAMRRLKSKQIFTSASFLDKGWNSGICQINTQVRWGLSI